MGKKFIHSTCGQPMVFNFDDNGQNDKSNTPRPVKFAKQVRVGGGAWVITRDSRIPKVVITEVTDDECEMLKNHPAFQNMVNNGFMSIHDVDYMEEDSRGLPADHQKKDGTSQIIDEDHANGTDERITSDGTRASYGEGNQYGGVQPITAETSDYGPIRVA